MKHLKFFENKSFVFTKVDFTGGGDGVYALYINGELFKYGDYYHDKITIWIDAFIEGIKWYNNSIEFNTLICKDDVLIEEISEMGGIPPKSLSSIK